VRGGRRIDRAEARRIARLAHLELPRVRAPDGRWSEPNEPLIDDATLDRIASDMNEILAYVAKLSEVDVSNVPPTNHGVTARPAFRADVVEAGASPDSLLEGVPRRSDHGVLVPKIVE
jgi:aspartyl-tRNA(Asn)/glutamyl-tRNA(Gln) amidotransferase subunit C